MWILSLNRTAVQLQGFCAIVIWKSHFRYYRRCLQHKFKSLVALEQVFQKSWGCLIPGCVQSQAGLGLEQPGRVEGFETKWSLTTNSNPSVSLWLNNKNNLYNCHLWISDTGVRKRYLIRGEKQVVPIPQKHCEECVAKKLLFPVAS